MSVRLGEIRESLGEVSSAYLTHSRVLKRGVGLAFAGVLFTAGEGWSYIKAWFAWFAWLYHGHGKAYRSTSSQTIIVS